ncbi:MAG TPA: S46 family peptidase, partial [Cytophagales bacterium]|nr:S46 family peptidase [Cytophagales bacterium]
MKRVAYIFLALTTALIYGQAPQGFGTFDSGKMWTFDNPPLAYFEKEYGFKPSQAWLDSIRQSALRFGNGCSASFISAEGLVMTNHHCARSYGTQVQKSGENFNENGFLAQSLKEERRVPGLHVDQLVMLEDVSQRIKQALEPISDDRQAKFKDSLFKAIEKEYKQKWIADSLEPSVVTFYRGAKYSVYGFKRFKDVRLVLMPELNLGFFGGDYDNFTYPRYALDFTFFRVYGKDGKPYRPKFYYKVNLKGAQENEPVFVVGNPGTTERLSTGSQLSFAREIAMPYRLMFIRNRIKSYKAYNEKAKSDSINNIIFSFSNADKALTGMLAALNNASLMGRKSALESHLQAYVFKNKLSKYTTLWDSIAANKTEIRKHYPHVFVYQPSDKNAKGIEFGKLLAEYLAKKRVHDTTALKTLVPVLTKYQVDHNVSLEASLIKNHLEEFEVVFGAKKYAELSGSFQSSKVYDPSFVQQLKSKLEDTAYVKQAIDSDFLLKISADEYKLFTLHKAIYDKLTAKESKLNALMAQLQFEVFGGLVPPDANFNLRIADGIVKSYDYNGTKAPFQTTFYGLYDRYFSFGKQDPWRLPKRWQ